MIPLWLGCLSYSRRNTCFVGTSICIHYNDVIMGSIASQITSLTIVYWIVYLDADQRKHQSSASLAFVWVIHRGPVNSLHKWPVTRKMFPFDTCKNPLDSTWCGLNGVAKLIVTELRHFVQPERHTYNYCHVWSNRDISVTLHELP